MGIIKDIKRYFKKKAIINGQLDHSIPNYSNYNPNYKTIVFVNGGIPTPDKDSGSNRLKEIILLFKELNYNCIICTKNAFRTDQYINYFVELGLIVFVETNQYKNYYAFLKSIPKVDFVWYYSPNTLKDNLKKIQAILPNSKSIFDMVDIHFLRYKRALELEPTRISFRKKHKKFFKIETKLAQKADYVVTISDVEKKIMTQYIDPEKLLTISNVHYFKAEQSILKPFEERKDIIFIGSAHEPNIDAVNYLYNDIMPIVWQQLPDIKVNIIGNVSDKINNIDHANFNLLGHLENIESYFLDSKLMIAPLRFGAGVKGKIGQAFEYYLPVVTTTIGAEGMNLISDENVLLADTAQYFANCIIKLYSDKNTWLKLQNSSGKNLEPFSKKQLKKTLLSFK